jgi:hypothetical protein
MGPIVGVPPDTAKPQRVGRWGWHDIDKENGGA